MIIMYTISHDDKDAFHESLVKEVCKPDTEDFIFSTHAKLKVKHEAIWLNCDNKIFQMFKAQYMFKGSNFLKQK